MEDLSKYFDHIQIPTRASKIYKDECAYSFCTQESNGGLLIDLMSFVGFSHEHALLNYKLTSHKLYLNICKFRVPKKIKLEDEQKFEDLAARLTLPDLDFDYEEEYALVILPAYTRYEFTLPNLPDFFPLKLQQCILKIIELNSTETNNNLDSFCNEELKPSAYAHGLLQLENGVKVPDSGWKCEKCGLDTNLWLNLTDGSILCGRRQLGNFGGNNHAFEHYQETGYVLVVKLGTITPDGNADVYSYALEEDCMVHDPYLEHHLLHWGIVMKDTKKTDKSVAELEVLYQSSYEWRLIVEDDCQLTGIFGPGYTGMINLGNSCYMNSVMQLLFSIPEFECWYTGENAQYLREHSDKPIAPLDLEVQLAKLGEGLTSGEYSKSFDSDSNSRNGIKPTMFKALMGEGHIEFSTNQQQDAVEFFQYILEKIRALQLSRLRSPGMVSANNNLTPCSQMFNMELVYKLTIESTNQVKYNVTNAYCVLLPVVLCGDTTRVEAGDKSVVRPVVTLDSCFSAFTSPSYIEDLMDPSTQERVKAKSEVYFSTFPPYLAIQISKFTRDETDWTCKKIDIVLDVPDEIDLEKYRGSEHQHEKNSMLVGNKAREPSQTFDSSLLDQIVEMGFTKNRARQALTLNSGSLEAALEWLFTTQDGNEDDQYLENASDPITDDQVYIDGDARYSLFAFISHIGPSTSSGHYVIHIKKQGQWVLFNDEKVGISQKLPKEFGYLYFYRRKH